MIHLWERMTHLYNHKWTAKYGETAVKQNNTLTDVARTWVAGLRGVTAKQMATGLQACCESGDDWPPSLPKFRAMCVGKKTGKNDFGLDYVPQYYRTATRITDKSRLLSSREREAKRADVAKHIQNLKAALRK